MQTIIPNILVITDKTREKIYAQQKFLIQEISKTLNQLDLGHLSMFCGSNCIGCRLIFNTIFPDSKPIPFEPVVSLMDFIRPASQISLFRPINNANNNS